MDFSIFSTKVCEKSMSLSTVKPLHAKWLVSVFQKLEQDKDLIKRGFSDAGIV